MTTLDITVLGNLKMAWQDAVTREEELKRKPYTPRRVLREAHKEVVYAWNDYMRAVAA